MGIDVVGSVLRVVLDDDDKRVLGITIRAGKFSTSVHHTRRHRKMRPYQIRP